MQGHRAYYDFLFIICEKFLWESFSGLLLIRFNKFLRFQLLCSERDRLFTLNVAKYHIIILDMEMLNAHEPVFKRSFVFKM